MGYKKYLIATLSSILTLGMMNTSIVVATSNPLASDQSKNETNLENKAKEKDVSHTAQNEQPFSIKDEAYSLYSGAKQEFNSLQKQYGSLDEESNAGAGFTSYLKTIREDKNNQQLQAKVNQMSQGGYDVSVSVDSFESLATAVQGVSDEDKKDSLEAQEKQDEEKKNNSVLSDDEDEYDSDKAFGAGFNANKSKYEDSFNKLKEENDESSQKESEKQVKEFGDSKQSTDDSVKKEAEEAAKKKEDNKNSIQNEFAKDFESQKNQNNGSLSQAESDGKKFLESGKNKTILKNYSTLRTAIINAQKAVASAGKSANTSKAYANKVKNMISKA